MEEDQLSDTLALTAQIVSAYVSRSTISADALPSVIESVHRALNTVGQPVEANEPQQPAVPIKKSVFPDHIVCLEDGKKLKMLKRHLMTSYGMTPKQYRAKWGLPHDYPMVAPAYAEKRSGLARAIGLGTRNAERVKGLPSVRSIPAGKSGIKRGRKAVQRPLEASDAAD